MRVAVTGASGFVGRHLSVGLESAGYSVLKLLRTKRAEPDSLEIGDLGKTRDFGALLQGVGCVFHAAAHVHVPAFRKQDILESFRRVNVEGTRALAEHAVDMGVQRFVYISSIGVLGSSTVPGERFSVSSRPAPTTPYAVSKLEAEKVLIDLSSGTGLELVIIRPPLVYGRGAPGNFGRLIDFLGSGFPLPLASVRNLRSMIGIDNLVNLLVTCTQTRSAVGNVFLASDGQDISTPDLLRLIGRISKKPIRLFPCPVALLSALGKITGKSSEVQGLTESLQIDITHTRATLGWTPLLSLDDGLRRAIPD